MLKEPKFKFNDKVIIVNGFYQGQTGIIYHANTNAYASTSYDIVLDKPIKKEKDTIFNIGEDDLLLLIEKEPNNQFPIQEGIHINLTNPNNPSQYTKGFIAKIDPCIPGDLRSKIGDKFKVTVYIQ